MTSKQNNSIENKPPTIQDYKDIVEYAHSEISRVRSVYKWLISIVGIVIVAGLYFSYNSTKEFRSETEDKINKLKVEAEKSIEKTQKHADDQISQIRVSASEIALEEAQKRINDAFQKNNINEMIEMTAKAEVGTELEKQVNQKVNEVMDNIQDDIVSFSLVSDAAMRMRVGIRDGLDELIDLQKTSTDSNIKERAKILLNRIASDYEISAKRILNEFGGSAIFLTDFNVSKDKNNIIPDLIKVIHSDESLDQIALAIIILREKTGEQFRMFDIEEIDTWFQNNK